MPPDSQPARPGRRFDQVFSHSQGVPRWPAGFRTVPEDFEVCEVLGFPLDGSGEHLCLHIRKIGENTRWVASLLAGYYGVAESAVGYCGLKDRQAVTTQWFSVHLPGAEQRPALPALPGCEVLGSGRHSRKLRPGMHQGNGFRIRLRDLEEHRAEVEGRLALIAAQGVPNYFGEQRFGIQRGNLAEVDRIVAHRSPRFRGRRGGLYLSAARSWLFNLVLCQRVAAGNWNSALDTETAVDGPLWGRGRQLAAGEVQRLESEVLVPWQDWCLALEHSGLRQERRQLVLRPGGLDWSWEQGDLRLEFSLPPGCYATALLRELAVLCAPAPVV